MCANVSREKLESKVNNDFLIAVVEIDPSESTHELVVKFGVLIPTILFHTKIKFTQRTTSKDLPFNRMYNMLRKTNHL